MHKKKKELRARSSFKLMDIDDEYDIISGATRIVDLCAAPGSWSQVLRMRASSRAVVVAVDLQPMVPIENVKILQGDITTRETADAVVGQFENDEKADLVVCDGAPEVTGLHDLDEHVHADLLAAALGICVRILQQGATFVAKIFRSSDAALLRAQLKIFFATVDVFKPKSSRDRSVEAFVICRGFSHQHSSALNSFATNQGDLRLARCSSPPR